MPKVDIVIPCYNYGRFLGQCLRSVLSQSVKDIRVLVIDDASTDGSGNVVAKLARADSRVSLSLHLQNHGHIATYNEGIAWAESDYFLLLSADDLLAPNALDRAVRVMDTNPNVVLTYGNCAIWHDRDPVPALDKVPKPFSWRRVDLVRMLCETATNFVPTPTTICRTGAQKTIGGYRPKLPHAGDLEMWLRFGGYGEVAFIDAVQGAYRKHDLAISNAYWANMLLDYRQRSRAFQLFFDNYNDGVGNQLRTVAERTLADLAFQSGINAIRRGQLNAGVELIKWSMATDRDWQRLTALWKLLKVPGPDGRRWASSRLKKAAIKAGGGSIAKCS